MVRKKALERSQTKASFRLMRSGKVKREIRPLGKETKR